MRTELAADRESAFLEEQGLVITSGNVFRDIAVGISEYKVIYSVLLEVHRSRHAVELPEGEHSALPVPPVLLPAGLRLEDNLLGQRAFPLDL